MILLHHRFTIHFQAHIGGIVLLLQFDERGNMAAAVETSEASASGGALLDHFHDASLTYCLKRIATMPLN